MKIGIPGAGYIGETLARDPGAAGCVVKVADTRGPSTVGVAVVVLAAVLTACVPNDGTPADTTDTSTGSPPAGTTGTTADADPTTTPTTGATDTSTGDTSTGDTSTGDTSTGDTSTGDTSTGDTSTGDTSTGDTTTGNTTTGDTTTGDTTTSTIDTTTTDASTGPVGECTPGASEPCYSGPPETLEVGLCVGGERTCDEQGVWGGCVGEVLPAPADCEQPGDEACDGEEACSDFVWHKVFGKTDTQGGNRIAFDGTGNLVVAAQGIGTIDFGGGPLIGAGSDDLFLVKYAPDGTHLWSQRFGDAAQQFNDVGGLAVAANGDIVVTGDFAGTMDFGGGPLIAKTPDDAFLVRFDPAGNHLWSKSFAGATLVHSGSVAFTASGDILLGGTFDGTIDLGGGPLTSAGSVDSFVARFTGGGALVTSKQFGAGGPEAIMRIVPTSDGGLCVGGLFDDVFDLGTGPLHSKGGLDVFIGCLDAQGKTLWSSSYGDWDFQTFNDMAIDDQDHLTIGGMTWGAIDFGGGILKYNGYPSYVAQFDAKNGAHRWSRLVSNKDSILRGISSDSSGGVLLVGDYSGVGNFGGGQVANAGVNDAFLLKLDGDGGFVWVKLFGSAEDEFGLDVATSSSRVAMTGQFFDEIDLGGGVEQTQGDGDGFIAVFDL